MKESVIKQLLKSRDELEENEKSARERIASKSGGNGNLNLILTIQDKAACEYFFNKSVLGYRDCMREIAWLACDTYERAQKGEDIADCYLNIYNNNQLFLGLSGGAFEECNILAKFLDDPKGLKGAHIYTKLIGQAVRDMVLGKTETALEWISKFNERCKKHNKSYAGLGQMIEGVLERDAQKAHEGLKLFLSKYGRVAASPENELPPHVCICVDGLAIANWARHTGLDIEIPDSEYLPKDLLVPLEK